MYVTYYLFSLNFASDVSYVLYRFKAEDNSNTMSFSPSLYQTSVLHYRLPFPYFHLLYSLYSLWPRFWLRHNLRFSAVFIDPNASRTSETPLINSQHT